MKYKTILFPLLMVMLLAAGCTDDVVNSEEGYNDGRVIGSVHGVVTDSETNTELSGVKVTWVLKGVIHTTTTNSQGYYAITNLTPGEYEMTFTGTDSYAVGRCNITINDLSFYGIDDIPTGEDFHVSILNDVDMYLTNAAVTGVVYAKQDDETTVVASGVTVIADFSGYDLSGEDYTTVTDASGVYLFENLPATDDVDLRTMPFNDGTYDFGVQTLNDVTLRPNYTVTADNIIATIATATPIILVNNFENDDFGLTEDIIITFSKAMDPTSFDISLSSINYGTVEFTESWTNNITLTLDPLVPLQASETYTLSITGMSMDNNGFSATGGNAFTFGTISGIEFVSTNLERVDGMFDEFPVDSDITLTFDMAIDLDNSSFNLSHVEPGPVYRHILSTVTLSADEMTVTISPNGDLEPGQSYNVSYFISSYIEGDNITSNINFSTDITYTVPGQVTGFVLNEAAGWTADWATSTGFDFKWNAVADATTYIIYAKDNYKNSDFVMLTSVSAVADVTYQTGTFDLLASFDYYPDAFRTPFLYGTDVQFGISAYNAAGEGPISALVTISDETPPTAGVLVQTGTANGTDDTFTIKFNSSGEYLDDTEPVIVITDGGGVDVLTNDLVSFEWDADMKGGTFTIDNSAGADFTGDTFIVNEFYDTSGNMNEVTVSRVLN